MTHDDRVPFRYLFANQKSAAVVTFIGDMDSHAADGIKACWAELERDKGLKTVVLYFRDVSNISGDSIGLVTQIQKELRARSCRLNICSLKPNLKEKLINLGVVRRGELSNNLGEAMTKLVTN